MPCHCVSWPIPFFPLGLLLLFFFSSISPPASSHCLWMAHCEASVVVTGCYWFFNLAGGSQEPSTPPVIPVIPVTPPRTLLLPSSLLLFLSLSFFALVLSLSVFVFFFALSLIVLLAYCPSPLSPFAHSPPACLLSLSHCLSHFFPFPLITRFSYLSTCASFLSSRYMQEGKAATNSNVESVPALALLVFNAQQELSNVYSNNAHFGIRAFPVITPCVILSVSLNTELAGLFCCPAPFPTTHSPPPPFLRLPLRNQGP